MYKGPLQGFKVIDMSSVVSGPMAAVMLADQGADVIKIEPPGWGDGIRRLGANRNGLSAIYAMINRNKRSLALNFKHPRGKDLLLKLAKQSDVLLQNYRPGKFIEESVARFDDHFSDRGFLHDVESENRKSVKSRRYPIKNIL